MKILKILGIHPNKHFSNISFMNKTDGDTKGNIHCGLQPVQEIIFLEPRLNYPRLNRPR